VSSAALLDVQEAKDKKGKPYYKFEILTRTGEAALLDMTAVETPSGAALLLALGLPTRHRRLAGVEISGINGHVLDLSSGASGCLINRRGIG